MSTSRTTQKSMLHLGFGTIAILTALLGGAVGWWIGSIEAGLGTGILLGLLPLLRYES